MNARPDWPDRCPTLFVRQTPGKQYVNARWQCPRKKLKGLPYCSYCEPSDKKRERLTPRPRA